MAVVFPNPAIARRWNGALKARLMRAPLEEFLRSRGIATARAGAGQDSDDVTRAAVQIIEAARAVGSTRRPGGVPLSDSAIVAHLSCLVTRTLAALIENPDVWRVAALVCTAQILSPLLGLTGAAVAAAAYVRRFENEHAGDAALDIQLAQATIRLVINDVADAFLEASSQVASRLSASNSNRLELAPAEMEASSGQGCLRNNAVHL